MSFINGSPLAGMGATPAFEFERPQNSGQRSGGTLAQTWPGDGFGASPIALPIQSPIDNPGYGDGSSSGNPPWQAGGYGNENAFFGAIMNSLSSLIQQIASYFNSGASGAASAGGGYTSNPVQSGPIESAYTTATASSTGDPHDAFSATTAQGGNVSDKWDSMKSHADLLDSDSFHGGYRVSTTTTAPNAAGVTYNASATVTTHDGNDAVTLNKDGSYSVVDDGRNVALVQGQAMQLGRSETVTLNADKSLTIVDTNHRGGSLTTTLTSNGNGVDVSAQATSVDLGGYLVDKTDRDSDPVAFEPNDGVSPASAYPYRYGNATEPLGAGELEFA